MSGRGSYASIEALSIKGVVNKSEGAEAVSAMRAVTACWLDITEGGSARPRIMPATIEGLRQEYIG